MSTLHRMVLFLVSGSAKVSRFKGREGKRRWTKSSVMSDEQGGVGVND